jgi:DNA replication protein DnaC
MTMSQTPSNNDDLLAQAKRLKLHGLLAHWEEFAGSEWLPRMLQVEDEERRRRSLIRRIGTAHIGRFKPWADFDWSWPKEADRELIEELFTFDFLKEAANVAIVGPNGIGKSMLAQNLAHQAVLKGYSVRFVTASQLLNELAAQDMSGFERRLKKYTRPGLLCIDEIGYLSYNNRHADILYEVVSGRYEKRSTVLTTNRPFGEWGEVFPNASCVVTLVDRLIHRSEIVKLEGESFRLKEAKERAARKRKARSASRRTRSKSNGR